VPAARTRDAERSRAAILAAAERLFAERGFDGASLSEIGAAAGLSRATPSYFFGSKERLYGEVLERAFAARQAATEAAFAPVRAWCESGEGADALRAALAAAAAGYLDFLAAEPRFAQLVVREELAGGERLRGPAAGSTAMRDAFRALRAAGPARGVREFAVEEAIVAFVSLTFGPTALRRTLMRAVGRDLALPAARRRQAGLAADVLMRIVAGA
jgi:TetR/AcrR family transcriptional regulator